MVSYKQYGQATILSEVYLKKIVLREVNIIIPFKSAESGEYNDTKISSLASTNICSYARFSFLILPIDDIECRVVM